MIIWSISLIKGNCSSLSAETWHKELKLAVVPKKVSKRIISLREVLTKRSQDWVFCRACDNLFNETRASCTPVKYVKISVGGGGGNWSPPYPTLPYRFFPHTTLSPTSSPLRIISGQKWINQSISQFLYDHWTTCAMKGNTKVALSLIIGQSLLGKSMRLSSFIRFHFLFK